MSVSPSFLLSLFFAVAVPWMCMSALFFVCYLFKLFLCLLLLPLWHWVNRRVCNSQLDSSDAQTAIRIENDLDLWLLKHDAMTTLMFFMMMLMVGVILSSLLLVIDKQLLQSSLEIFGRMGKFGLFVSISVMIVFLLIWSERTSQKEEKMLEVCAEIDKLRFKNPDPQVVQIPEEHKRLMWDNSIREISERR